MMPLWLPKKPQSLRYNMRRDSASLMKVSAIIIMAFMLPSASQAYLM